MVLASCQQTVDNFQKSDLYGTWQAVGTQEYVCFLSAEKDTIDGDYLYGYEWDEADETEESDMWNPSSYHGNGWFKWKLVEAELKELHLMDNDGAPIPKIYTVTKLTSSELVYKDNVNREHSFSKVVFKEGEDE